MAGYSRYMRSSMLDELTQDYVRTAIAKGATKRRVLYRHVLRNAMIPMVTLVGLSLPTLVGGALLVEQIFNIHGHRRADHQRRAAERLRRSCWAPPC